MDAMFYVYGVAGLAWMLAWQPLVAPHAPLLHDHRAQGGTQAPPLKMSELPWRAVSRGGGYSGAVRHLGCRRLGDGDRGKCCGAARGWRDRVDALDVHHGTRLCLTPAPYALCCALACTDESDTLRPHGVPQILSNRVFWSLLFCHSTFGKPTTGAWATTVDFHAFPRPTTHAFSVPLHTSSFTQQVNPAFG